jgi:ABC-2 type transport system permease protein
VTVWTGPDLDLAPGSAAGSGGRATYPSMVLAHARLELTLLVRNGEQLLLTVLIPVLLLVFAARVEIGDLGSTSRIDVLAPGILALAVLSTAFTSLAIGTGFERRYGVLKRLGSTPLTRSALLGGKALAVLAVEAVQVVLVTVVAIALGWRPTSGWPEAVLLILLGTLAFASLGLLMAGTLRAEATLAAANLVYLVLLLGGGIVIPLSRFPEGVASVVRWLPSAALAEGLRSAFAGVPVGAQPVVVLVLWSVVGVAATARFFRWE